MILLITAAGYNLETDALQNGTPIPKIKDFVIDTGVSVDGETVQTIGYVAATLAFENVSPGVIKIHSEIPPDIELTIKGIALRLEDNTIFAYGYYQQETNGFYKGLGFAFAFTALLTHQSVDLTFVYSPLDITALAEQISNQALAEIANGYPVFLSKAVIEEDFTIPTSYNAGSIGATIADGVTVTIPNNSTWQVF